MKAFNAVFVPRWTNVCCGCLFDKISPVQLWSPRHWLCAGGLCQKKCWRWCLAPCSCIIGSLHLWKMEAIFNLFCFCIQMWNWIISRDFCYNLSTLDSNMHWCNFTSQVSLLSGGNRRVPENNICMHVNVSCCLIYWMVYLGAGPNNVTVFAFSGQNQRCSFHWMVFRSNL